MFMRALLIAGLSKSGGGWCAGDEQLLCEPPAIEFGDRWPWPVDGGRRWLIDDGVLTSRGGESGSFFILSGGAVPMDSEFVLETKHTLFSC